MINIRVGPATKVPIRSLVDSGAINTVFPMWVAVNAEIDLTHAETRAFNVGGAESQAVFVTTRLEVDGHDWEAEVGFSNNPRLQDMGLLGHKAFFRYFSVRFDAVDERFDVTWNEDLTVGQLS